METTLEVISDLGDVRDMGTLYRLVVFFCKLEFDFLGEEVFEEKVHDFDVLFLFKVVVAEHHDAAADHQFSTALVLIDGADRSIAGIGERS